MDSSEKLLLGHLKVEYLFKKGFFSFRLVNYSFVLWFFHAALFFLIFLSKQDAKKMRPLFNVEISPEPFQFPYLPLQHRKRIPCKYNNLLRSFPFLEMSAQPHPMVEKQGFICKHQVDDCCEILLSEMIGL